MYDDTACLFLCKNKQLKTKNKKNPNIQKHTKPGVQSNPGYLRHG